MKFKDQPEKQELMVDVTRVAMEEQQNHLENQIIRENILKRTQQELEGNQNADFKYRLYRLSQRSLTESNRKNKRM
jgi:hypothetical protein